MLQFNNLFKERLRLTSPILGSLEKLRLRRNKLNSAKLPIKIFKFQISKIKFSFVSKILIFLSD